MNIYVGKPTAELHTKMNGGIQTSIRKAVGRTPLEGLYNKQEQS